MAASDYVPISFKNRLHLAGRPQMSTRAGGANEYTGWRVSEDALCPPAYSAAAR